MRDAIQRYLDAAQSLTEVPRARAEQIAKRLAGNGVIDRGQIRSVATDLVSRSRENSRRVTQLVTSEIGRQISRLGLATSDDIERLGYRVQALEIAQRGTRRSAAGRRRSAPVAEPARGAAKRAAAARVSVRKPAPKRSTTTRRTAKRAGATRTRRPRSGR